MYYLHFLEHVKLRETCTIYINDLLKLEIHVNSLSKCLSKFFIKSTTLITSLSSLEIDIRLSSEIPKGMMSSFDDFSILPRIPSASFSPSPQTPPSRRPMTELINHTIHVILHVILLAFRVFFFLFPTSLPLVCTIFIFWNMSS